MYDVIRPEQFGGRVIEIRRLWVPQPVWVSLWGWAETPQVDFPGLLWEWEGRGPAGKLVWRARVSLVVDGPPPAAWNERHPWVRADQVRPRGVTAAGNVPPRDD